MRPTTTEPLTTEEAFRQLQRGICSNTNHMSSRGTVVRKLECLRCFTRIVDGLALARMIADAKLACIYYAKQGEPERHDSKTLGHPLAYYTHSNAFCLAQ
jgi:hypothetical protein